MREPAALGLLAIACVTVARSPLACARPASPSGDPASAASVASTLDATTFALLASRATAVAPGMREVARVRSAGDAIEVARAGDRDACVRVAFEATSPVLAKLVDRAGNVLASNDAPATGGVLGKRGPVCVRKGDAVSVVAAPAEGATGSVRWVAWQAP